MLSLRPLSRRNYTVLCQPVDCIGNWCNWINSFLFFVNELALSSSENRNEEADADSGTSKQKRPARQVATAKLYRLFFPSSPTSSTAWLACHIPIRSSARDKKEWTSIGTSCELTLWRPSWVASSSLRSHIRAASKLKLTCFRVRADVYPIVYSIAATIKIAISFDLCLSVHFTLRERSASRAANTTMEMWTDRIREEKRISRHNAMECFDISVAHK